MEAVLRQRSSVGLIATAFVQLIFFITPASASQATDLTSFEVSTLEASIAKDTVHNNGRSHSWKGKVAFFIPAGGRNGSASDAAPHIHQAQGSINLSPNVVETGTASTVTISTPGFFDLSEVDISQIGIRPNQGISNVQINSATAQRLTLSFRISLDASPGIRTLFVKNNTGMTVIALDLTLKLGSHICQPPCIEPFKCKANVCVRPPPPPPPPVCSPRCNPPEVCDEGRCILPQ